MTTFFVSFFLLVIFLFSPKMVLAQNLLQNPGFENTADGKPIDWNPSASTISYASTSSPVHDGSSSVSITKTTSTGYGFIFQEVNTDSSKQYKLSGWALWNDSAITYVKLRIEWHDAQSSSRLRLDEVVLAQKDQSFQFLELGPLAPPQGAAKAKIEGYIYLNTANPANPALFDDLNFEETSIPIPTPIFSPIPTSQSSTPTPTFTPQPQVIEISFILPSSVALDKPFDASVSVKNADANVKYFIKLLAGISQDSSSLSKASTYSTDLSKWLPWNGNWVEMPSFTTDNSGQVNLTLRSKIIASAEPGSYYFKIRIRKEETSSNIDSSFSSLTVKEDESLSRNEEAGDTYIKSSPTSAGGSAMTKETNKSTLSPKLPGEILGEEKEVSLAANFVNSLDSTDSTESLTAQNPQVQDSSNQRRNFSALLFILGGASLLVGSIIYIIKSGKLLKLYETFKGINNN